MHLPKRNDVHGTLNEMSIFGLKQEFAAYKLGNGGS